jgi:5'-nucleotidase
MFGKTHPVFAKKLHIIHTNDLHSYFESHPDGRGGYSKLKTKILELKAWGKSLGAETLVLDAGDWGEGTSFYLTEAGVPSLKALEILGIDYSIIGNHDYMFGGNHLAYQMAAAKTSTRFLSANLFATPELNLNSWIKPIIDVKKSNLKIRLIGLSTDEPHFQYALRPGKILDPINIARAYDPILKQGRPDAVIAITHIGVKKDVELVSRTKNIDLVVGGHSHTRLPHMITIINQKEKIVPIVQTGAHGLAVGSLLVDIENRQLRTLSYQLHDIESSTIENPDMKNYVLNLIEKRNQEFEILFGKKWDELIGMSEIPLSGYQDGRRELTPSCWGQHMARMVRDAAKADVGFHIAAFEGKYIEKGLITFGDLVENFPHVRRMGDPGWEIVRFHLSGMVMKSIRRIIQSQDNSLGINLWPMNIELNNFKIYTVAMPLEIFISLRASLPKYFFALVPIIEQTGVYYWPIMEKYIRDNSPLKCINDND